jgi:hypothetical protein
MIYVRQLLPLATGAGPNNPRRVGGGFILPGSMEGGQTIAVLSLAVLALRAPPGAVLCAH